MSHEALHSPTIDVLPSLDNCKKPARDTPAQLRRALQMQGPSNSVIEAVTCRLVACIFDEQAALVAMRRSPVEGDDQEVAKAMQTFMAQHFELPQSCTMGHPPTVAGDARETAVAMQKYMQLIVKHLRLPDSCTIAALIFILRAAHKPEFAITLTNWQPILLSAFVIATKLSFDEPVWNEDFVKALHIKNVHVAQVSQCAPTIMNRTVKACMNVSRTCTCMTEDTSAQAAAAHV